MSNKSTKGIDQRLLAWLKKKSNLNKTDNFNSDSSFLQERFRQANLAFNLLVCATALSSLVSFTGVGLLFLGRVSEGTVTTAAGLVSNVAFAKLAKDANDRFDRAIGKMNEVTDKEL